MNKSSQNSDNMSNQSSVEKKKEFRENEPGINEPEKNDPTRKDKPPLIISKL